MDTIQETINYASSHSREFFQAVLVHLQLSGLALLMAALVGVPLGIWISRYGLLARVVVNIVGIVRVVPSIAVLFLLLPLLGIGFLPALIALTLLAIPPLLINTDAGMRGVDQAVIEAGRGMGMSQWQLLGKVRLPLALPVMLAGLRIATVEVIASATLATLIGGGGLGDFIAAGLTLNRDDISLVGAVPVALLALLAEQGLGKLQREILARQHAG